MDMGAIRSSPIPAPSAALQGVAGELDTATLVGLYDAVRSATQALCDPLTTEDYVVQSMPDASPIKWHLAHTTWFFETFVLSRYLSDYSPFHPQFGFLFNSYYEAEGPRWTRAQRGLLSRPTVAGIYRYRTHVDEQMARFLRRRGAVNEEAAAVVVLGLHHEQQHQELILTDLKHAFALNPLHPVYREALSQVGSPPPAGYVSFPEGIVTIGHQGRGFGFDNEFPRHKVYLRGFKLGARLVSSGEYLDFIADGGYERPELWLSDGWAVRQARGWNAPIYWEREGAQWFELTLGGRRPLPGAQPVCHVSYYEADAFARWAGARLPTEAEWETAAASLPITGHFLEAARYHPSAAAAAEDRGPLHQLYGDVWQWTANPYTAYPGFKPLPGALGEYNGKFMCNQFVLRGASCVTPRSHARLSYRNFFPADARWQFAGIRLAKDPE